MATSKYNRSWLSDAILPLLLLCTKYYIWNLTYLLCLLLEWNMSTTYNKSANMFKWPVHSNILLNWVSTLRAAVVAEVIIYTLYKKKCKQICENKKKEKKKYVSIENVLMVLSKTDWLCGTLRTKMIKAWEKKRRTGYHRQDSEIWARSRLMVLVQSHLGNIFHVLQLLADRGQVAL